MAWYDSAVFYHIHSLSLCGCEHESIETQGSHFDKLTEWAEHAKKMGCNAIYIGPVFKAEMHGHGMIDYYKIDSRLGTNEDFKKWIATCHEMGMRVVVEAVFNHVGRGFFAFQHLRKNGKKSAYREWFSNINFAGDNEYGDGFQYENWGGYMRLVKLNILSPWLHDYYFDVIHFWISEFGIDGIHIDAIDEMDYDFIKELRKVAVSLQPDFWLMGEISDQEYTRWVNDKMLHSAPNHELQKGFVTAYNDGKYPLIPHLLRRADELCPFTKFFIYVDNRDLSHIYEILNKAEHQYLITLVQFTVYGIPALYCGSEFSLNKAKTLPDDENLQQPMNLADYKNAYMQDEITYLHCLLGRAKQQFPEFSFGCYQELLVTENQFAFGRILRKTAMITVVNNDEAPAHVEVVLPLAAKKAVNVLEAVIDWEEEPKKSLDITGCRELTLRENVLVLDLPGNRGCLVRVTA